MEGERFEAGADGLVLAVLSFEAKGRVEVEQQGEAGRRKTAGGEPVEVAEGGQVEPAGIALVGEGGCFEAVADDDGAALESGADDLGDHLGAGGEEGEGLGPGDELLVEEGAHNLAGGGAAGFTVTRASRPRAVTRLARAAASVDLPAPSPPSSATKIPGAAISVRAGRARRRRRRAGSSHVERVRGPSCGFRG